MPLETDKISIEATNLFLFIGPADSGKTYAATSFGLKSKKYGGDDERPCYLMELDGRIAALRNRPIQYDAFTNEEGAVGVINRLIEIRENCIKWRKAGFHTLIFDSATSFGDFAVSDSLDVKYQENKTTNAKRGRFIGELDMLTVEDYGYEAEAFRKLLWENLLDIKKYANVIVIAHEVPEYKTEKGKPGEPTKTVWDGESYKMLMHGNKIASKLPTKFDEIYHFMSKEVVPSSKSIKRQVRFQDTLARSSYPSLAASTEKYDISNVEFYNWWKDKINQSTTK